jgi:hypothetical protein
MTGTMTWAGLDVHARWTQAAAIDSMTGESTRKRFGAGVTERWRGWSRWPVRCRACYEAGPTRSGLYRAATAAGVGVEVTRRARRRVGPETGGKTDRRDAERLWCLRAVSVLWGFPAHGDLESANAGNAIRA